MTRQLARRITALCIVLTALAAAACGTLPSSSSSGGGRTQQVDRTPIGQAHYWGAMSEDPDAPPSQV